MLLKDVLKDFVLELEIRNYSIRTLKGYKNNNLRMFTYLEKEFSITEIEEVKTQHVKSYIKFLQSKKLKESYINGVLKCFRAYFKYAIGEEFIFNNPIDKVRWVKEPKSIINTFTDDEVDRMMKVYKNNDFIDIRNKCVMAILFDTGIRCLELCTLKNKDIKENYITVIQGKGKKDRRVSLSPISKKIINRYLRCRDSYFLDRKINENSPFFISYRCQGLTNGSVERVVKLCGIGAKVRKDIRCSPHTCRHYFAQAQLRNGLDVYSLSRLMGHENIHITKRYLQGLQDTEIIEMGIKTSPLMNLKFK